MSEIISFPAVVATTTTARPAPNISCPDCGYEWFIQALHENVSIQVATICPKCKDSKGITFTKRQICELCKSEMHERRIFDLPFEVKENFDWCLRCNLAKHLSEKYEDQASEKLDEIEDKQFKDAQARALAEGITPKPIESLYTPVIEKTDLECGAENRHPSPGFNPDAQ